jgi:hypothetical protein
MRTEEAEVEGGEQGTDGRWRRNICSYPLIGSPDGGAHCKAADLVRSTKAGSRRPTTPQEVVQLGVVRPDLQHLVVPVRKEAPKEP